MSDKDKKHEPWKLPDDILADLKNVLGESEPDFSGKDTGPRTCCHFHLIEWIIGKVKKLETMTDAEMETLLPALQSLRATIAKGANIEGDLDGDGSPVGHVLALKPGDPLPPGIPEPLAELLTKIMGGMSEKPEPGVYSTSHGALIVTDEGVKVQLDPYQSVSFAAKVFAWISKAPALVKLFQQEAKKEAERKEGS